MQKFRSIALGFHDLLRRFRSGSRRSRCRDGLLSLPLIDGLREVKLRKPTRHTGCEAFRLCQTLREHLRFLSCSIGSFEFEFSYCDLCLDISEPLPRRIIELRFQTGLQTTLRLGTSQERPSLSLRDHSLRGRSSGVSDPTLQRERLCEKLLVILARVT